MLLSVCSLSLHTIPLLCTQSPVLSPPGPWAWPIHIRSLGLMWVLGGWLNQPVSIQLQGRCWPSQQVQTCVHAVPSNGMTSYPPPGLLKPCSSQIPPMWSLPWPSQLLVVAPFSRLPRRRTHLRLLGRSASVSSLSSLSQPHEDRNHATYCP